jgi:hypothetical protein
VTFSESAKQLKLFAIGTKFPKLKSDKARRRRRATLEMVAASRIDRNNTRCMIDPLWIWKLRIFVSMKFPNLELLEQKGLLNLLKREEI